MGVCPTASTTCILQELFTQLEVQHPDRVWLSNGSAGRSLLAAEDIANGEPILALPLAKTRTSNRALARLRLSENTSSGLVPGGIDAALLRCSGLLPGQKAQVFLLALGLLADLRSQERAGRADMRVLPYPPGSPLAAVCTAGTPATDLQLFSAAELAELQCMPLAVATIQEQHRLAALHSLLFSVGDAPAAVSLQSLVWAHCLVRSRALSLQLPPAAGGAGATRAGAAPPLGQLDMCMLPGVDLCNHPTAGTANCAVHLTLSRARTSMVELRATRDIGKGQQVLLSYGDRPLRDFLRGYGFLPHIPHEIFEDFGGPHQALLTRGSASSSGAPPLMFLQEVVVLSTPGCHSLLDHSAASLLYIVGSEYQPYGARLILHAPVLASRSPGTTPSAHMDGKDTAGEDSAPDAHSFASTPTAAEDVQDVPAERWIDPQQEASICRHLAEEALVLLSGMGSAVEADEQLLSRLEGSSVCSDTNPSGWAAQQHLILAVQYRLARKRLLLGIIDGLETQQHMLCAGS